MASFKSLPIASIHIGERTRPVDDDHALAIAASMAERGLLNPITVRATPAARKGKTPYTLVAGGHRLRAAEMNQWGEIDAIVVEADALEAQLMEISENLYRNELNKLDRAIFVLKFRELWEEKHGKITPGGDQKSKGNHYPLIYTPGRELSKQVQNRLGFGEETYKLVNRIGQKLDPTLRKAVRGTKAEDDQTWLLKLARLSLDDQMKVAAGLEHDNDVSRVFGYLKGEKQKPDADETVWNALTSAWAKASPEIRDKFLDHIGAEPIFREAAE